MADALDRTATALGETGAPESPYTSPGSGHVVVEAFRTVGRDGEDTNYEMTGDLIVELQKGGTITTGTVRREVLVLLDVDDEPYSVVRVQKGPESDLATVEQALRHLTHAWDDVRRPPWRVGATA